MAETMLFIAGTAMIGGAVFYAVAMLILTMRERRARKRRTMGKRQRDKVLTQARLERLINQASIAQVFLSIA